MTLSAVLAYGITCVMIGLLFGVPLGRWSLLLLMRWSWQQRRERLRRRNSRQVPGGYPPLQVEHAGQYVQHDRIRAGVCQLEPPDWFTRVRS